MSRRSRNRPGWKGWAALGLAAAAALRWAWLNHPTALTLAAMAACALALLGWQARCRWLMRAGRLTDVYRHYFHTGRPLYFGKSVAYDLRCGQHEIESWWWYFVDPAQSVKQTFPNEDAALRAEAALIRRFRPIGNYQHNPDYMRQHPERLALQAEAAAHRSYAQPPPVVTRSWAQQPHARTRARAYGVVR